MPFLTTPMLSRRGGPIDPFEFEMTAGKSTFEDVDLVGFIDPSFPDPIGSIDADPFEPTNKLLGFIDQKEPSEPHVIFLTLESVESRLSGVTFALSVDGDPLMFLAPQGSGTQWNGTSFSGSAVFTDGVTYQIKLEVV